MVGYTFQNGMEVVAVAYLDYFMNLFLYLYAIKMIRNTHLPGASAYLLTIIVHVHAVVARQAGVCMRLYSFAIHISLSHTCLH